MRRFVGVLAVALAAGVGAAATSSNTVPASTAGYQSVRVSGGTLQGVSYTVTANTITALTARLKGPQVKLGVTLFSTVTAQFGTGAVVPCTIGLYDVTTDSTSVTCTPFTQRANASWTLQITVS
jgi:hypothetical protein